MQTNVNLDRSGLGELVVSIFEAGDPAVYLISTDRGEKTEKLASARAVNAVIDTSIKEQRLAVGFSIWYPETQGFIEKKKIDPDPAKSKGSDTQHSSQGWGIILLRLNMDNLPIINCCVSCSSQKKAQTWSGSHPELKNPDLWDWEAVKRYCGRLVSLAKELEKKMVKRGVL